LARIVPADEIAETVELTASQSSSRPADFPPEIHRPAKPEVTPKPVLTRQPSALAPLSQMWTDDPSSFQLPAESPGMFELGSCTTDTSPFHPETGNRNGNIDNVTVEVGEGVQAYRSDLVATSGEKANFR